MATEQNLKMTWGLLLRAILAEWDADKLGKNGLSKTQYTLGCLIRTAVLPLQPISEDITYDRVVVSRVMKGGQATAFWKKTYNNVQAVQSAVEDYYENNLENCSKGMKRMLSYVKDQDSIKNITRAVITGLILDCSLDKQLEIRFNTNTSVSIAEIKQLKLPNEIDAALLLTDTLVKLIRNSGDTETDGNLLDNAFINSSNLFSLECNGNEAQAISYLVECKVLVEEYDGMKKEASTRMSYSTIADTSRKVISYIYDQLKDIDKYNCLQRHISSFGTAKAYQQKDEAEGLNYYEKLYLPSSLYRRTNIGFAIEYNHDAEWNVIRLIYGIHKLNAGARISTDIRQYINRFRTALKNNENLIQARHDAKIEYDIFIDKNDASTLRRDCMVNFAYWKYAVVHTIALYDFTDPTKRNSPNRKVKSIDDIKKELDPFIANIKEIMTDLYPDSSDLQSDHEI